MSKELYDYWFVQFDFPNKDGKPYRTSGGAMTYNQTLKREIPLDWEVVNLSHITEHILKSINPTSHPDVEFCHYSIPAYDATKGMCIKENGIEILSNKFVIAHNDILISKLNPKYNRVVLADNIMNQICSTEFVVLRPSVNTECFVYSVAKTDSFIDYCSQGASGTSNSHKRIDPTIMIKYPFAYSGKVVSKFNSIVAAHIVNRLHGSRGWGRTKLQKALHLAEYLCELPVNSQAVRQTAGPFDGQLMNAIDLKFRQFRHVRIDKIKDGNKYRYNYTPTSLISEVEQAFEKYPADKKEMLDSLLDKLKVMNLARAEIVSTLYAVWNNRIIKSEPISDELIFADFYAWSSHKYDFGSDLVLRALKYMYNENIVPTGWGRYIDKM